MYNENNIGVPYNMSMLFYIELHELRKAKSRSIILNDYPMYQTVLEEIYLMVQIKMNSTEEDEFETLFHEANIKFINKNTDCKRVFRQIDKKLIKFMHKHQMIFPKVTVPGLKDLEERFSLSANSSDSHQPFDEVKK